MSARSLLLASAFVAALAALPAGKAAAASWLEKNFYLSGPQYEGKLPPCDYRDALVLIASFLALLTVADLLPTREERRAGLVAPLR